MNRTSVTEGSLVRSLGALATPMLVSAVLQNIQSLIDLFWVGRLGPSAVAAVAMSGTILMVLFPMLMGVSVGTIALVARAIGAKRQEEANHAAGQSLVLALLLGMVSGAIGSAFSGSLFTLLGASADVAKNGEAYLRISLLGSFTVFTLFIANAALQGAGDAMTPMCVMGLSNLINIVLDPVFIFGVGPWEGMGVRGAAVATVLAQAGAAAMALRALFSGRSRLQLRLRGWRPDSSMCWRILRIGIPGSGQMLARSLMNVVMMRLVATCGTSAVAAYGVGMRFHMIILLPAFALGGAAATLVGQNLGAGKPQRARRAAWMATAVDMAFMVLAAFTMVLFAPHLVSIFNADDEVVRTGARYLRIVSPAYLFAALGIVLGRALNGAGDSLAPMVITIIALWGVQVPLAILFSRLWQPATQGIWWAIVVAIVMQGLLVTAWFETGRWKTMRV